MLQYVLVALTVALGFLLVRLIPFNIGTTTNTVLEGLSILHAALVGAMSLLRYYVKKERLFMFIGLGFLGAGLFNGFNMVVTSDLLASRLGDQSEILGSWTWVVSGLYLGFMILHAWYIWWRKKTGKQNKTLSDSATYVITLGLTVAIALFFFILPLPSLYFADGMIGRPVEILPAALFGLALLAHGARGLWRKQSFDHWLIISLILLVAASVPYMLFSTQVFDINFAAAKIIRMASYVAVEIGLLSSMFKLFKRAEKQSEQVEQQNLQLLGTQQRSSRSLSLLKAKEHELNKKVSELKVTRRAMLNVLEDLDHERTSLQEEKAKDEAILSSIGDGLVVTDNDRKIVLMNAAAEKLTGRKFKQAVGSLWPEVLPAVDEDGKKINSSQIALKSALEQKSTVSVFSKYYFTRANGTRFPVAATASPILVDGEPAGAIVVFRDITKEAEIDRTKTEFVSLASHQLRTPLSTVSWYAEMLLDEEAGKINKEQKLYLNEVYHANQRMVELVNALLNVSRLELGTFSINPSPVNFAEASRQIVKELEQKIIAKKLQVEEKYDDSLKSIPADQNLVRIIFQNLISNAVKYTNDKGSVSIEVKRVPAGKKVGEHTVKEESVAIVVADTGYGIPVEQQDDIFGKLFRADNAKSREPDGNGLGLYIVKSILDQGGGKVWFDSTEGKGSTFYVTLPITGMQAREGTRKLN